MKKILMIFLSFFLFLTSSFALSPAVKSYPTSTEFLEAEGGVCESATDGCNTIGIVDWKLWASTMMYCENIYGEKWQENWSCIKYKDWYTDQNLENLDDPIMCTMEYAPVCAEVQIQCIKAPCYPIQQTFWNACSAWRNKVLYTGECDDYVDINLYNTYLTKELEIKNKLKNLPTKTLEKALELIWELMTKTKEQKISMFVKKIKITKYMFLKYLVENQLNTRY